MKIKHKSRTTLRKKAWKLKSEYVRRKADGQCYTCTNKKPWKQMQAGHYIHKNCLDYDPIGIQCQCVNCNKWNHGRRGEYALHLVRDYGMQAVVDLEERAKQDHKFNIVELEEIILDLQQKLQELK